MMMQARANACVTRCFVGARRCQPVLLPRHCTRRTDFTSVLRQLYSGVHSIMLCSRTVVFVNRLNAYMWHYTAYIAVYGLVAKRSLRRRKQKDDFRLSKKKRKKAADKSGKPQSRRRFGIGPRPRNDSNNSYEVTLVYAACLATE